MSTTTNQTTFNVEVFRSDIRAWIVTSSHSCEFEAQEECRKQLLENSNVQAVRSLDSKTGTVYYWKH